MKNKCGIIIETGEEDEKNINFVGNVEPREVSKGDAQVLVCDGFVGNTVLKMYEGVIELKIINMI